MNILRSTLFFLLVCPLLLEAQSWSVAVGSGPFVFGDFAKRTFRISNEDGTVEQTVKLSAATRPGLTVGIERALGSRFAIRATGTYVRSPLRVGGDDGVELESTRIEVATLAIPVVFRINRNGAFRFYVYGGPAHAAYRIKGRDAAASGLPIFEGTRTDWGVTGGGGVSWQLSERLSVDGEIDDTVTRSPFRRSDLGGTPSRLEIPRPHNVHTTVGLRWHF